MEIPPLTSFLSFCYDTSAESTLYILKQITARDLLIDPCNGPAMVRDIISEIEGMHLPLHQPTADIAHLIRGETAGLTAGIHGEHVYGNKFARRSLVAKTNGGKNPTGVAAADDLRRNIQNLCHCSPSSLTKSNVCSIILARRNRCVKRENVV